MNLTLTKCPKCSATLGTGLYNRSELGFCPACALQLQVEVFPAAFRRIAPGQAGEAVMLEGESSCFYHPQKKAAVACDACGRFLCALCDCDVKGQHLCPACLESGQRKRSIQGLEDMRMLHGRLALMLSFVPVVGIFSIWLFFRHRKKPGSLVQPRQWAFSVALALGIVQLLLIVVPLAISFLS